MADTLVETKLMQPRSRREIVARPRLIGLLDRAAEVPVTLVSAPAGFGKTTLVSAWLGAWLDDPGGQEGASDRARTAGWVSLTGRDRDPSSFWTYVLHALDRAVPGAASTSLTLLRSGQAPLESILAGLVNELSVFAGEVTVVLDDYHLADGPEVADSMAFLVEHLPPQLRLVLTTRADPALPLARLRARGELVEIRAADLRFTADEVSSYLNDLHGLALAENDVAILESRTEGWAAALQLAALSLRDRTDTSAFIAGFAGDDRFVVDFLADEVLSRQPADVRRFLLDTAVLDRLTAPLCEALSPAAGSGRELLDLLERQNLFLVPLDDHRRWYRYHHLFADVLLSHLLQERPDDAFELHGRASRWYAENGYSEEAVRHALAAGDIDSAATLVELAIPDLRRNRREDVILRWARELPAEIVDHRPVLAVGFIGALMAGNDFETVAARLRAAEQLLASPEDELVVADRGELSRLPGAIETYWAGLALVAGDNPTAIERAERAIGLAAEDDDLTRSAAAGLMGLALWATGDLAAAHRAYTTCAEGLTRADHIADVLGCSLTLADMELALGRLDDAERTLQHAIGLAENHHEGQTSVMRGTADMLVARSRVAWHRNDLELAADLLRRADDLGEAAGLPQNPYRWLVAMARLRATEQNWASALDLLDQAQRVYVGDFSPPVHPIHATRARLLTAAGDLPGATAWAQEHALTADDELTYLREYEHLTLARLLLVSPEPDSSSRAAALLGRLRDAAEQGGRVGTVIEVEALRARALHSLGHHTGSLDALERAVDLGEPHGWVRFFVDSGPEVVELLRELSVRRPGSTYLRGLIEASAPGSGHVGSRSDPQPLLDPLSDRELEVLRLLASDLDGPGIAGALVVSLNTVRTHTKHIYTKLGVNSRRAAVSKGHQLGLLSRARLH